MRRGTTPTLQIAVNGVDLDTLENIYITLKQGKMEITKQKASYELMVDGNVISVFLSQEDTLALAKGYVYVQMRAVTAGGNAIASEIEMVPVEEVLKEGVIT